MRPAHRYRPAGEYLRSALGRDLVVIGTYFGHGAGFTAGRVAPPNAAGMDGMLSSLSLPVFSMDHNELPGSGAHYPNAGGSQAVNHAPYGSTQLKFSASSVLPVPFHFATWGKGHNGRVRTVAPF